jgi:hypothetical protein
MERDGALPHPQELATFPYVRQMNPVNTFIF